MDELERALRAVLDDPAQLQELRTLAGSLGLGQPDAAAPQEAAVPPMPHRPAPQQPAAPKPAPQPEKAPTPPPAEEKKPAPPAAEKPASPVRETPAPAAPVSQEEKPDELDIDLLLEEIKRM